MRPEDLLERIRKRPFVPFRVHVADGKALEVHHPDQIIVFRSRAVVGAGDDNGLPDHWEHVALVQVDRLKVCSSTEPLEPRGCPPGGLT